MFYQLSTSRFKRLTRISPIRLSPIYSCDSRQLANVHYTLANTPLWVSPTDRWIFTVGECLIGKIPESLSNNLQHSLFCVWLRKLNKCIEKKNLLNEIHEWSFLKLIINGTEQVTSICVVILFHLRIFLYWKY
jgi:hypothetical protein